MGTSLLARGRVACRARLRSFRTLADAAAAYSAWLVCGLVALVGLAVLDDYGVGQDDAWQRNTARIVLDYVWGRNDELLRYEDRTYGVAVEVPLLWAERLLGLQDSRAVHLLRHLLTHLIFLAGGLGCAALAFRLYGSRLLALCALALFLLHPRMYAHSFFNSKDAPFLSLFMLALLLMHWTFRRNTAAAFLLCGAGVGVLINVRILGISLFGAVLALRACDLALAADRAERRHILGTSGLFAGASALTLYALWPYLWSNPIRHFTESLAEMAQYPVAYFQLFRGHYFRAVALPAEYVPVWFAVTAPPPALLLGGIGLAGLLRRGWRRPGALLRPTRLRFESLALACCLLPLLAVILLNSTLYSGWRHMYFLYGPFCLLATGGLHALAQAAQRFSGGKGLAYGLASGGAGATLGALVLLHPYQHLYFNFLEDRATPERLRIRYDLDYFDVAYLQALEFLLAQYLEEPLYLLKHKKEGSQNRDMLPAAQRPWIELVDSGHADFLITPYRTRGNIREAIPYAPVIHARQAYGSTVVAVAALNLARVDAATAAPYRATYRALAAGAPVVRSRFDVYLDERAVSWVQAPCRPADLEHRFVLRVVPVFPQDLPRQWHGAEAGNDENLDFFFEERGVRLDDACLAVVPRPPYPIHSLQVGQWIPEEKGRRTLWQAEIPVWLTPSARRDYRAAYRTLTARPPMHRAVFDAYVTASRVTFVKVPCTEADTAPRFILHVVPRDPRTMPDRPFENLDFFFAERGARFDDACLASVPLPDYPIRFLTFGQRENEIDLWRDNLPLPLAPRVANAYRAAYRALAYEAPARQAAFDVYVTADAVAYAKEPCTLQDTQPKFILHIIPAHLDALPPDGQRAGFANRDFEFAWQGAHFDGACLARAALPDYPIARLRVGQFRSGEDPLWLEEIPLAP